MTSTATENFTELKISVNYVHYDNVLKRIYLFLRHMVKMTAAVFSKPSFEDE